MKKGLSKAVWGLIIASIILGIVICFFVIRVSDRNYIDKRISEQNYDRFPESAEKVRESLVEIWLLHADVGDLFRGTGFFVDKDGYILTARHVFTQDIVIPVGMSYSDFISSFAQVRYKNQNLTVEAIENENLTRKDVQLLKLKENNPAVKFNVVEIANYSDVTNIGVEVGFLGFTTTESSVPLIFVSKSILSCVDTRIMVDNQTDAFYSIHSVATGGYSGGPVFFAENGKVIGLIKSGKPDPEGKSGIVYIPYIHDVPGIIDQLKNQ